MRPKKCVSLTFRGFSASPEEIESFVGCSASEKGLRGEPVRPNAKASLKRSFVRFAAILDRNTRLDEVVPILIAQLGGVAHLNATRDKVDPEFLELNIVWPVKGSDEQEGGFFPPQVISDLSTLQCTLTFEFL